jgi:hypothetical protein
LFVGCGVRDPNGRHISHIRLPNSGEEWIEAADFRPNGICYFGHPLAIAECRWWRQGKTIRISRNGVELIRLQFDGKQLVYPAGAPIRSPYVRESK